MRFCSYVVRVDKGLAPNPFYRYCTLAVCTPNHMGNKNTEGDWFLGTTTAERDHRLQYAMKVFKRLHFNEYYNDPRFLKKKPQKDGTWRQRCGDNMYYQNKKGRWRQHPTEFHNNRESIRQDLKYPYVFVSKHFYYFGEKAPNIPKKFRTLIWPRSGCKCSHEPKPVKGFLGWLESSYKPGIHGLPMDREELKVQGGCGVRKPKC